MYAKRVGLLAAAALFLFAADAQSAPDLSAFIGIWKFNPQLSRMERAGPNGVQTQRSSTFTWVFGAEAGGLRMNIYAEYPAAAPSVTMFVNPDGLQHPCEMRKSCLSKPGDPKDQSFAFRQVEPNMMARVFQIHGRDVEYNFYVVSTDHKTLVAISWDPQTPQYRNSQVFERQP